MSRNEEPSQNNNKTNNEEEHNSDERLRGRLEKGSGGWSHTGGQAGPSAPNLQPNNLTRPSGNVQSHNTEGQAPGLNAPEPPLTDANIVQRILAAMLSIANPRLAVPKANILAHNPTGSASGSYGPSNSLQPDANIHRIPIIPLLYAERDLCSGLERIIPGQSPQVIPVEISSSSGTHFGYAIIESDANSSRPIPIFMPPNTNHIPGDPITHIRPRSPEIPVPGMKSPADLQQPDANIGKPILEDGIMRLPKLLLQYHLCPYFQNILPRPILRVIPILMRLSTRIQLGYAIIEAGANCRLPIPAFVSPRTVLQTAGSHKPDVNIVHQISGDDVRRFPIIFLHSSLQSVVPCQTTDAFITKFYCYE